MYGILLIIVAFLAITYSMTIAVIYMAMIVGTYFLQKAYNTKMNFDSKPNNTFQSLLVAILAVGAFTIFTMFLYATFKGIFAVATPQSIFAGNLQSMWGNLLSATLILEKNVYVTFFTFAILIPYIETMLLITIYEAVCSSFGIDAFNWKGFGNILVYLAMGAGFVWFHIQAKGLGFGNDAAVLGSVFFFAILSCGIAAYMREKEAAIYAHQLNNGVAIYQKLFAVIKPLAGI